MLPKDGFEWRVRMNLQRCFEQKAELAQSASGHFGRRDVLEAIEQFGEDGGARFENEFVGIRHAEADDVAIGKRRAIFGFLVVDENAALLAAIFQAKCFAVINDSDALAGDTAIGELEMISGFSAAAD